MASHTASQDARQLRRQLNAYIKQAKENEHKLNRIQNYEIKLISASGLDALLKILLQDYKAMTQLQQVILVLVDSEHEIRRLITELGIDLSRLGNLKFVDHAEELPHPRDESSQVWLGDLTPEFLTEFVGEQKCTSGSVALLPLIRNELELGTLVFISNDPARYTDLTGTDFLIRLASFVAVCLENAINQEKVKRLGLIDPLTAAYNRRYFDQRLEEETRRSMRAQSPLSCLFLDIDHFKQVNDNFGHAAGDFILQSVVSAIREQMRASDILARIGGEEFVALLVQTDTKLAMDIADRIRAQIASREFTLPDGRRISVTISIGCASLASKAGESDIKQLSHSLLEQADDALYTAKRTGRNRVVSRP